MSILNTCSGKRFLCLAGLLQASLLSAGNLFFNSGAEMGTAGFALWRLMNPKTNPEMRFSQPIRKIRFRENILCALTTRSANFSSCGQREYIFPPMPRSQSAAPCAEAKA